MVFSAENVTVLWGGTEVVGFADGDDAIDTGRNQPATSAKTGIKGETVFSINGDKSGYAKLKLFSTSASLPMFTQDAENAVAKTLVIRDAGADSGFILSCDGCRILDVPGKKRGQNADSVEVNIYIPKLSYGT